MSGLDKSNDSFEIDVNWYKENRTLYEKFTEKITSLTTDILNDRKIAYCLVESRTKELPSFKSKLEKRKIKADEVQDLTGLRIVGYVLSDADKISRCIREIFHVISDESIAENRLGIDKVGYQSRHFICQLPGDRTKLPEYSKFRDMIAEIQVRTLLQHAWAEIGHDPIYKFSGILPTEVNRDYNLLSAALEMADKEFERILKNIAPMSQQIKTKDWKISIDPLSLRQYMLVKLEKVDPNLIKANFGSANYSRKIVEELEIMNVKTLEDLDKMITTDFVEKFLQALSSLHQQSNYMGFVRNLLMVNDANSYFNFAWRRSFYLDKSEVILLNKLGVTNETLGRVKGLFRPE